VREHDTEHEQARPGDAHASPRLQVQVVVDPALAEDQLTPRQRARGEIGSDQRGRSPALEVRDLERRVDANPQAGAPQPVTEFDVFDAGRRVAFVEARHGVEGRRPDGAARAPEREAVRAGDLVPVPMRKVLVLREKIRGSRRRIVRADHGGDAMVLESACNSQRWRLA
jgi:hypothetical protein